MKNIIGHFLLVLLLLASCSKKSDNKADYYKGEITVTTDESFQNVTEALSETYSYHYPEAKVNVVVEKENQGIIDLLKKKVDIAVMSRELTEIEKSQYSKLIDIPLEPARFAGDAVLFIVPKNSSKEFITMDQIEQELNSDTKNIIVDNTNSSNLNTIAEVVQKKPEELKFSVIKGNINLINELDKYSNKIGVISLNTISRMHSEDGKALRSKIKILPIKKNGKLIDARFSNIKTMEYPFTRILYFVTNEGHFGMANGFIRFACTNIGQKVVQKEGLQKYYLYERKVKITK